MRQAEGAGRHVVETRIETDHSVDARKKYCVLFLSRRERFSVQSTTLMEQQHHASTVYQKAHPVVPVNLVANHARMVEWFGGVSYENLERVTQEIKRLMVHDPAEEIQLLVNSFGGATGIGMSFYDTMTTLIKPNLVTVGSGDVDSSGIIVFLTGRRRFLTKNTTLLLHLAGRTLDQPKRYSSGDFENMLREDKLKDYQYACVVSDATNGMHSPEKVLALMEKDTILSAEEALAMGLAHRIL